MSETKLTEAEVAEVGDAIAAAVSQALAPVFDKLAEALAAPPGPTAPAKVTPAPAPASIAVADAPPAAPTHRDPVLAELEEEIHFLQGIAANKIAERDRLRAERAERAESRP